jgi:MFS transporter, DHA1 family, tetracycline resistance protein
MNNTRVHFILFITLFMDTIGIALVMPLIPFYALKFGASPSTITLLFSLHGLMQFIRAPLWGIMSDRFGRRAMLAISIIGSGIAYLWLSQLSVLWMLFAYIALSGIVTASLLLGRVYISDITTKDNRTGGMAMIAAANELGFCFGPIIGGILLGSSSQNPNLALPPLFAAAMSLLAFITASLALPESKPAPTPVKTLAHPRRFSIARLPEMLQPAPTGLLILLLLLLYFGGVGIFVILPLWSKQQLSWGPKEIGYTYVFWGIIAFCVQAGLVKPLAQRFGEANLLLWGLIVFGFGIFLMPFSTNVPLVLGAIAFISSGYSLCIPVLNSLLSQAVGARRQGEILAFAAAISALAGIISPVWTGFIFESVGSSWSFWSLTLFTLVASVFSWQVATGSHLSAAASLQRQRKMKRLFDVLDYDKNGVIEPTDFDQVVKTITELRGWQIGSPDYWVIHSFWTGLGDRLQSLMDADGDGKITPEEWMDCMLRRLDIDFADAFTKLIDSNEDGKIALDELKMFYQAYKIDADQAEASFAQLDLNKDGHISPEEMKEIFDDFMYSDEVKVPGNFLLLGV